MLRGSWLVLAFAVGMMMVGGGVKAATLTWDCTRVPNICSNDCYAIQCAGKPTTLHRDSAQASTHRAETACKSPNRCANNPSDSNSCDEYPYASSSEGGAGSVTRCVPATENSRQGGTLSSFYTNNGIVVGDAYTVAFASTSGLQYCSGSCTNTGNELTRRNLALGPQHIPRHFVTNESHLLTMFERVDSPGELDSLVGTQTWLSHEERNVTIVRAIPSVD